MRCGRLTWLVAAIGLVVGALAPVPTPSVARAGTPAVATAEEPSDSVRDLRGVFVLIDPTGRLRIEDGRCWGIRDLLGLGDRTRIRVTDATGEQIGTGALRTTGTNRYRCTFAFEVGGLPLRDEYRVHVGARDILTYSRATLDERGWELSLEFGDREDLPAPVAIRIPILGVSAPVVPAEVDERGVMADAPSSEVVAWYPQLGSPGTGENVVMAGFFRRGTTEETVFSHLAEVRPGDEILLRTDDGVVHRYRVQTVDAYADRNDVPIAAVVGETPVESVTLMTGAFPYDEAVGDYAGMTVVRATIDPVTGTATPASDG